MERMFAFRKKETTLLLKMNFGVWRLQCAVRSAWMSVTALFMWPRSQVYHRDDVHAASTACWPRVFRHVHGSRQCADCACTLRCVLPCRVCCVVCLSTHEERFLCCRLCSRPWRALTAAADCAATVISDVL